MIICGFVPFKRGTFLEVTMLLMNFIHNLRKLNPRLFVDVNNQVKAFGYEEYPIAGLYLKEKEGSTKFLMGVPHEDVPEFSIAAVDFSDLIAEGKLEEIQRILDTGFAPNKERLIWRGWRAIVGALIRMGIIDQKKAEKVFKTYFEPKRLELPRHYINKEI